MKKNQNARVAKNYVSELGFYSFHMDIDDSNGKYAVTEVGRRPLLG
ncbi:MAG: hypothetical protein OXI81_07650 [Paracoccaceae bacterium]|nr:hypothetical protein [Paracoccaceae bacterium]MDE2912085.1 hypothetical protein [Paracoccaceae bacterium]